MIGAGLVLALALSLSGLADGFHAEAAGSINAVGATSWVMARGAQRRVTAFAAFRATDVSAVAGERGVHRAFPVLFAPAQVVLVSGTTASV